MRSSALRSKTSGQDGFALIATVVVLVFLVAIAAAVILPPILDSLSSTNAAASASELQSLYTAIVGDQVNTFGYFGDVGAYPASLMDLVRDPNAGGSTPGWKGPYLNIPAGSIVGGQLLDAYGNPFEYYLLDNTLNNPDRVAVIGRGPDGQSSESLSGSPPANPNTASTFAGTLPTDNTYKSQTGNADNTTFPILDSTNNDSLLRRFVLGTFTPTIQNFDSNVAVNAYAAACPNLYTMTLTSATRGSADARAESVGSLATFDLPQGAWNVDISSPIAETLLFSQTVIIQPNATLRLPINLAPGINSASGTGVTTYQLAIDNKYPAITGNPQDLVVKASGVTLSPNATHAMVTTYNVPACAPVQINFSLGGALADLFTMPYGVTPYRRIEGDATCTVGSVFCAVTFQVTVINNSTYPEVRVYDNGINTVPGIQIGQVPKKEQKTYTVTKGDYITVKNNAGTVVYGPTQITGTISLPAF